MPLLKCSAGKAKPQSAIGYITNPKKAEIVSERNLFDDEDYAKQFEETAALYGKGKGYNERKYYHFKLSCARQDNLSPSEAHKFAEEVAAKLFQDYECVLATHTDTDTVHSHIIVNAVDPLTGKKLQFSPKDYIAIKDEVNCLGKEHGYTETDFRKRGKNSRTAAERKIMLNGGVSWKEELREVIVEAIGKSHNEQEFKDYLKACYGVEIKRSGKDYSYLHPQKQKPIRGAKLGTNSRTRAMRAGGSTHGGSTGKFIAESIGCIEREMQRLNFAAECAGRGTDAASEAREMERLRARREYEREQRELTEKNETASREYAERIERENSGVEGAVGADTSGSKYGYGKGD